MLVVALHSTNATAQAAAPAAVRTGDPEASRNIVLRLLEEVWNNGRLELCDELLAPAAVLHVGGHDYPAGPNESKQVVRYWRSALHGFRFQIGDVIADGDRVVAHVPFEGVQAEPILDIPATGRKIHLDETLICRIDRGRIVEIWETFDEPGLRRQLTPSDGAQQTASR